MEHTDNAEGDTWNVYNLYSFFFLVAQYLCGTHIKSMASNDQPQTETTEPKPVVNPPKKIK